MKKTSCYRAAAFAMCLLLMSCFFACARTEAKMIDFGALSQGELEEYAVLGEYKGIEIEVGGGSREEAVWDRVIGNMEIKSLPQEQLKYYQERLEEEYRYHASEAGMTYKELMTELGITERDIKSEAEAMTKKDIACALVQKKEGIEIGESEYERLLEKYVGKLCAEYGYTREKLLENGNKTVYSAMLYDKTTEFLILNNTIK